MKFRPTTIQSGALHLATFDGFSVYEASGLNSVLVNFRDSSAVGQIYYPLTLAAGEGATIFFPHGLETKRVWVEVVGAGSVSGVIYSRVW
jgi:hypothetical protein